MSSAEVAKTFSLPLTSNAVSRLSVLLSTYPTLVATPQDLYYKWEALSLSLSTPSKSAPALDESAIALLARSLSDEERRAREAAFGATSKDARPDAGGVTPARSAQKRGLGGMLGISPSTPSRSVFARASTHAAGSPSQSTPSRPAPQSAPQNGTTPRGPMPGTSSYTTPGRPNDHLKAPLTTLETLNANLELAPDGPSSAGPTRVALAVGTDPKAWSYRYMFERLGSKGEALDDRIDAMASVILDTFDLSADDIADAAQTSQDSVHVIGRLAPALAAPAGTATAHLTSVADEELLAGALAEDDEQGERGFPRLTSGNVVLEASRLVGAGSRTPLVFSPQCTIRTPAGSDPRREPRAGLFPGMIVGLFGRNGGAGKFVVDEILMPPQLPHASTSAEELQVHQHAPHRMASSPLSIVTAAGPFSSDSDLLFEPWHRLMDSVEQSRPDVLLLLGPFVAINHSALTASGQDQLPADIFKQHISARLARLEQSAPRTTAILIPSTKDAVSAHAAWPQPMLDKKDSSLGIPKRVKCLPNPSMFSVNEVVFGVTTGDVLRDVGKEETCVDVRLPYAVLEAMKSGKGGEGTREDPLARSCRHVLGQRSFYPLFPASCATAHPLDVTHSALSHFQTITPDVLLLPSIMRPFARVIDSTVIVNPGASARGKAGSATTANATATQQATSPVAQPQAQGCFARFSIAPLPKHELQQAGEESVGHRIYERARVDLLRL